MRKKTMLLMVMLSISGAGSILAREYRYAWIDFGFGLTFRIGKNPNKGK